MTTNLNEAKTADNTHVMLRVFMNEQEANDASFISKLEFALYELSKKIEHISVRYDTRSEQGLTDEWAAFVKGYDLFVAISEDDEDKLEKFYKKLNKKLIKKVGNRLIYFADEYGGDWSNEYDGENVSSKDDASNDEVSVKHSTDSKRLSDGKKYQIIKDYLRYRLDNLNDDDLVYFFNDSSADELKDYGVYELMKHYQYPVCAQDEEDFEEVLNELVDYAMDNHINFGII